MLVGKKMTRNPITVRPDIPVTEAMGVIRREKIHRLPVLDRDNRLVGIVSEKDLLFASPSPASSLDVYEVNYLLGKLTVAKVMKKKVITITEDTPIEEAARIMTDNDIGGLPIMRKDVLVGIITESDIFKLFLELFGTREKGIRITLNVPEKPGELAELATTIARNQGNIISMGSFLGEDATNVLLVIKVSGIGKRELTEVLQPLVNEIIDIRET